MKSLIYYQLFSENEVFSDAQLNVAINQMFTLMINLLDEVTVKSSLVIDGNVALQLQGDKARSAFTTVELITDSDVIFKALKNSYKCLDFENVLLYQDRILLKFKGHQIKLSLSGAKVYALDVDGIMVRNKTQIL